MMTTERINEVTSKLRDLCRDSEEKQEWLHAVLSKGADMPSDKEELAYLEKQLQALLNKNEELDEEAEPQKKTPVRRKSWSWIAITLAACVIMITFLTLGIFNTHKADNVKAATPDKTINSLALPKEEFKVIDYKVDGNDVVYNKEIVNTQHKVFANGMEKNSLSSNAKDAVNEMIQYMSHNATALWEKAIAFGIVDVKKDNIKDWLSKDKDGNLYYNDKGKDIFYQTKAFLLRSRISYKKMEDNSNYYTTGVNDKGDVVISKNALDLSGQEYVEVSNPEGSTEKYIYCVLVYCGNTVMKTNDVPGIPTEKIEIPKPKPRDPEKPSESKVSAKDPSKDPANQGKAPVGGGQNDGSENGTETTQAKLPESYSAPTAPSAPASSTAPAQDARISEPSQWSGAGKITDSNGTTTVTNDGSVTTPDGRNYSGLTNPSSVPPVESGANGNTAPSSSANFANSSMPEPAIDD